MNSQPVEYPIEISVQELSAWTNNADQRPGGGLTVLDVREDLEIQTAALADYVHIPLMDVPARFGELPNDHALVVLCHHGMRSAQAVGFLREKGFDNAINLSGGIDAWSRQIDPSIAVY